MSDKMFRRCQQSVINEAATTLLQRFVDSTRETGGLSRGFEVPIMTARSRRNFKSKNRTRIMDC
jgi:hypothetical protein